MPASGFIAQCLYIGSFDFHSISPWIWLFFLIEPIFVDDRCFGIRRFLRFFFSRNLRVIFKVDFHLVFLWLCRGSQYFLFFFGGQGLDYLEAF